MRAFDFFFHANRRQLHRLNGALITLIPKKVEAKAPGDYRPISLIHSFAKLVAKVLSNRLAPTLHQLVDINQSAFIKHRSIHDNFKLVELAAKALHRQRRSSLLLKLDISKAFDSVDWTFLLQVLQAMGFGERWREWISALVSTASTCILLNGDPGNKIFNRRGLRQGDPLSPMLFILVMETLHRLFASAIQQNVLAPSPVRAIRHQCSIYADDVVVFIRPTRQDLVTTREILNFFGDVSGLRTNLAKCQAVPIACSPEEMSLVPRFLQVPIHEFPITYLGLPLSVFPLRRTAFHPLIDKVATSMPTWKAALLNKAGRLTTVKAVMSATGIHTMIALKVPDWVIHEIDKRRRGFLWAGKSSATGGQCLMAWPTVCRPTELGGLGIPDLKFAAYALRLRWLWLQRTDQNRPWRDLELAFGADRAVSSMFHNSVDIELGDGQLSLFWADRWNGGNSPCVIAPDLCSQIRPGIRGSRTVAQALPGRAWIADIRGQLTVAMLEQYIYVWHSTRDCSLRPATEDILKWRWSPSATYSARSAYRAFFEGSTRYALAKPLWKAWAPLRVKFTIWLGSQDRLWTADRRHRHGLQDSPMCAFCAQDRETCDHLFLTCCFARQVWFQVSRMLGIDALTQQSLSFIDWWLSMRRGRDKSTRKGLDSTVMLVSWKLWKKRNDIVFRATSPSVNDFMSGLIEEASSWVQAGAHNLSAIGWPSQAQPTL